MSKVKFDNELRKMAKRANQRMVELEKRGIKSPAYLKIQSMLEMLGKRSSSDRGRRFSETGKGTENELRQQRAILTSFFQNQTSTLSGYNKFLDNVYEGADRSLGLKEAGITKEQYLELFEALPNDEADRMYYATFYIEILEAYQMKIDEGKIKPENALTITDIIREIEGRKDYRTALKTIGLTIEDINKARKQ